MLTSSVSKTGFLDRGGFRILFLLGLWGEERGGEEEWGGKEVLRGGKERKEKQNAPKVEPPGMGPIVRSP